MTVKDWLPEFKVSSESDDELIQYFFKTKYIDEVLKSSKWLVLGRKGTGKTAIYEYFKKTAFNDINQYNVIPLNFKDYPWPFHKMYKESMEGELTAYQKSWLYLITVKVISQIIALKEKNEIKLSKDLSALKKYFESIYGSPNPTLIEVIKGKLQRIEKISFPSVDGPADISLNTGEISFEDLSRSTELKEKLRYNAFSLYNYLYKVLKQEITSEKFLVIIDQLDENWLTEELDEHSKVLINLIHACQHINKEFNKNIKVVVMLRTDIYDTLRFNDKTKIYQDSAIEVKWDAESLDDMFFERIKKYKPVVISLDLAQKSNSIFEVRTVRHGASPFKHILRRSFYRPRDIIVFMNKIRSNYSNSKSGLYTSNDIYSAERDYSINIYGELLDEWINQKPLIEKYLGILQSIGVQTFTYSEYSEKYLKQIGDVSKATIDESLLFLFQNSIIGQKINVNWEYYCTNPYIQIDFDKIFHVNNALKNRLNLTEGRS
ncbi:MAG: hypothetical protein IPJ02_04425 [Chitinophagaceae bacterium]|nr:hypothetical protein [Chitinophagaceae bacterium]